MFASGSCADPVSTMFPEHYRERKLAYPSWFVRSAVWRVFPIYKIPSLALALFFSQQSLNFIQFLALRSLFLLLRFLLR